MPVDMKTYVLPVFNGDFALRYPIVRQYWTIEMAEQWAAIVNYMDRDVA